MTSYGLELYGDEYWADATTPLFYDVMG